MEEVRRELMCKNTGSRGISGGPAYLFIKRLLDIVGSVLAAVLFSPLFLITFFSVKLEDPKAPALYSHVRVGQNGESFKCWKFRSMVRDADRLFSALSQEQKLEYEKTFKIKDDPRVTELGRFIRKTSIDEMPQFYNVFMGEMSLVGPRPVIPKEVELYGDCSWVLTSLKPGITGYWQVHGRSNTTYQERIAMDVHYAQNRNTLMDMGILAKTFVRVIHKDGAY